MKSNSVESTDNHNVLKMRSIHLLKIKKLDKAFVVILLLYLFLAFFMITRFPKVWMDSSWTTIAPYTLITKGKFANPIVSPKGDGLDEPILSPALTQKILLACVYTVFGFGLIQSRVPSIFAGFFLIIITYYFAKKYYDQTIALLAIVLMASDNVFFVTSRTIRPEIFLALFASAAFFLFLHALESKSLTYFALSGIFMGLSLYTHPNSFLVLLTLLIIFFHQQKFSMIVSKTFWVFSLFCLIAFAPYAVYVIVQDYANNFSHFISQLGGRAGFLEESYLQNYFAEYERYSSYIYFPRRVLIFIIQVVAVVYAGLSTRRIDRYLFVLILVYLVLLPAWNPANRTPRYFMTFIPPLSILVSKLFIDFSRKIDLTKFKTLIFKKRITYALAGIVMLLFFINQIGGNIYILWKHKDNRYNSFIAEIKNTIPEGSRIWGSLAFWIGLHNYPYLTQVSPYEEVEKFKPQYAILYDSSIWGGLSSTVGRKDETVAKYSNIRNKMEELCSRRGTSMKRIENKYYGNIEIYEINWSD